MWQSSEQAQENGVHGCIYRITDVTLGRMTGMAFEVQSLKGSKNFIFTRTREYPIPNALRLVNDRVFCGHCYRPVMTCKLSPRSNCRAAGGKTRTILKTSLTQLMSEECPDLMQKQVQMEVCMDALTCGLCGNSMANQVVVPHPTLKMMIHESCEPAMGYGLKALNADHVL